MEIHVIVEHYNDLFSKADQRSIPLRSLNRDFIEECKMRLEDEDISIPAQSKLTPGSFLISQITQRLTFNRRKKLDLELAEINTNVHVKIFMPTKHRERNTEMQVVDRLHNYFHRMLERYQKEVEIRMLKGVGQCLLGLILMIVAILFTELRTSTGSRFLSFLEISVQPLAWFFLWEGFAKIFTLGELSENYHFYTKMARSQFTILSYEQPV